MQLDAPKCLWTPSNEKVQQANITHFAAWVNNTYHTNLKNYRELHNWSVENIEQFWEAVWHYFNVKSYDPYTQVLDRLDMPGNKWFSGATLNYTEHIFRNQSESHPAIIFKDEKRPVEEISWANLKAQVASVQKFLIEQDVQKGDRVVAFLPNCPEAVIAFLAVNALGAIWSSCSPDFGIDSVLDRFSQIEPKVLITCDGYFYNGKRHSREIHSEALIAKLSTIKSVIWVPFAGEQPTGNYRIQPVIWSSIIQNSSHDIHFVPVPFDHPIWVLYSSGTTGKPKAITHSHGGCLLEHLKYLAFHNDLKKGEKFFWYSTTGWMMWNYSVASLLHGATLVLYDGSPAYPNLNALWELAEQTEIAHFGTSAPYLIACMKNGVKPGEEFNLSHLQSIGSTGSPLPPEGFDYVYQHIKSDLWLCSMSGGTDVCTAFVGGCPTRPVFEGEIQCIALACNLTVLDEAGNSISDEVGEMVIEKPMPSMPLFFWNDPHNKKYHESYFEEYPGKWRHGDWVKITQRDSLIIYGRSDATLNRQGVRIGTAEIYSALDNLHELNDSLIVNLELDGGNHFMPLFVKLNEGFDLNEELIRKIKNTLREKYSPRHVPDEIISVDDIPYTISGKKMEAPVKKILMGFEINKAVNTGAVRNPDSIAFFQRYARQLGN